MKPILALLALVSGQTFAAESFRDDFTQPKLAQRTPARGDWKFAGGVARCTQDDALYAKNNDHGPVLWYAVPFGDAVVHFAYRPEQVRNHRHLSAGRPNAPLQGASARRAAAEVGRMDRGPRGIARRAGHRADRKGIRGNGRASAIAQAKTTTGLGFASGTFSVKDFSIQAP